MKVLDKAGKELAVGARVRDHRDPFKRGWTVEMIASDGVQIVEPERPRLRRLRPIRRMVRRPFTFRCNDLQLIEEE